MWNCIYFNGHHRSVCVNVEVISLYQRIPNSENWNYRLLNDKSKHWIMLWRNQAQRNFSGDPNTWLIRLYYVHFSSHDLNSGQKNMLTLRILNPNFFVQYLDSPYTLIWIPVWYQNLNQETVLIPSKIKMMNPTTKKTLVH